VGQEAASERHHCRNTNVGCHTFGQMRLLILLSTLLLFNDCKQNGKSKIADNASVDCHKAKSYFEEKLKEITWDKELEKGNFERRKQKLITDDFINKYLSDITRFKTKDKFADLYYHSIPDLQTENCWVVIEEVLKMGLPVHRYYLVDLESSSEVLLEVASFEDYPDGKKRMKSFFLDDKTLQKTKVMEYLGDFDDQTKKYEIITDSLTYLYKIETNRFILTKKDSIRKSKW
jgi:hypothetical protein